MIKTFLPIDFHLNPAINAIYDTLSIKISKDFDTKKIKCNYNSQPICFYSASNIKTFLLAKDFYNYSFPDNKGFFGDLFRLNSNILLKNIVNRNLCSCEEFYSQYSKEKYSQQYKTLQDNASLTVCKFKKSAKSSDVLILEKIEQIKTIENAFCYTQLLSDNRHTILTLMDVPVCPYCNVNYITNYKHKHKDKTKTTADLDHFYIKSSYPQYGLCLYNFVPSCPVCNSKLKGVANTSRETHIFPHENSFDGKGKFEIVNLIEVLHDNTTQLKVNLKHTKNDKQVANSVELFKINERYDCHKEFIKELLEKVITYNKSYTSELQSKEGIFDESLNVKNLVFGLNLTEEMYARQSLGKLRIDLLNQLGVFEKL